MHALGHDVISSFGFYLPFLTREFYRVKRASVDRARDFPFGSDLVSCRMKCISYMIGATHHSRAIVARDAAALFTT